VADSLDGEATVADALRAVGHPTEKLPSRPVLHGAAGTVLLLSTFDPAGRSTAHGVWVSKEGIRWIGPRAASSLLAEGLRLSGPTAELVNLFQAAARSYIERLESLAERVDGVEAKWETVPIPELGGLHRTFRVLREAIGRFSIAVEELDGPLGERFPGLAKALPRVQAELSHLDEFSNGLGQSIRDLLALRNAAESNRLSEATNRLGSVSNQIAAVANISNIRMLGIAYVALILALVSAVVLIPNTAATILGMPSAGWVPGLWIDVILAVLAVAPFAIVFSRSWVRAMLREIGSIEARTREGLKDLPEIQPSVVDTPAAEERLSSAPPAGPP
jgi:hypothetical protein